MPSWWRSRPGSTPIRRRRRRPPGKPCHPERSEGSFAMPTKDPSLTLGMTPFFATKVLHIGRSPLSRAHARGRFGDQGIVGPVVARIAALQLGLHGLVAGRPEAREVARHLHGAAC